jgi:DHA1 family bicyclomycin/chloramphenicol resistance-like MFS transporter
LTDIEADRLSATHGPLGFAEFIVLMAAIMALNPLAMDIMLPALPDIGVALKVSGGNHLQAVLALFLVGFGVGQIATGPLSDRFGRRPVLLGGMMLYCAASLLAILSQSFTLLLVARLLQGLGTSATRVIATSVVRDCYAGRRMARVMSLVMMVFISVPILAPSFGQVVRLLTQWRGIFVILMVYGCAVLVWTAWRLPETLPAARRRSIAVGEVIDAFRQTVTNRVTMGYALAAGMVQGILFGFVFASQQMFTDVFGMGVYFPLAFAAIAVGVALAGFANSRLVGRFGMRVMSHGALLGYGAVAAVMLAADLAHWLPLSLFLLLSGTMMFAFGVMFANFTALAMEPLGHIAGTASSFYGSITTLIGIVVGSVIGQSYDGTLLPFLLGYLVCTLAAIAIVIVTERGRLFVPHQPPLR